MLQMINPHKVTNFKRNNFELEEFLLFCIIVAGKTAYIQADKLQLFIDKFNTDFQETFSPFEILSFLKNENKLLSHIVECKLGQYKKIHKAFDYLASNKIDLFTCSIDDLEKIPGVGPKTSRFFLLHSRHCEVAILDTHVLKWFKSIGCQNAPTATPSNKKIYKLWEKIFLQYCFDNNKNIAEFDLEIWNKYSKKGRNYED
jgi:thermostable 8-oxoguanine DNA glycosylase